MCITTTHRALVQLAALLGERNELLALQCRELIGRVDVADAASDDHVLTLKARDLRAAAAGLGHVAGLARAEDEVVVRDVNAVANLNPIGPIAASCIFEGFQWNWHHTLLLKTVSATAAFVILEVIAFALERANMTKYNVDEVFLGLAGTITFFLYPSITLALFTAFVPRGFESFEGAGAENVTSFLAAANKRASTSRL